MKRGIDLLVGGLALVVLSPILLVVAALVRIRLGSPVLFRQQRLGSGAEPFEVLKFRTMTDDRGPDGELLPDDQRLTWLGQVIRSSSLDEVPQFLNVLRGEMSVVGPRPLPLAYLERFTPTQSRRHEVKPGLTGWSQVNGRNSTSWQERLAMDVWYVDHRSVWLDVRIMAATVPTVVRRTDVSADGHATMPELEPQGADDDAVIELVARAGGRPVSSETG